MKTNDLNNAELQSPNELWLPVETNNTYEISNLGRLRHTLKNGRMTYLKSTTNGRKSKYLFYVIDGIKHYAHQLVLSHFTGEKPEGYECDHIDCDPTNNALHNLRYRTIYENRSMKGSTNPQSKLTEAQVKLIRIIYARGWMTMKSIGLVFKISITQVHMIIRRKQWQHV